MLRVIDNRLVGQEPENDEELPLCYVIFEYRAKNEPVNPHEGCVVRDAFWEYEEAFTKALEIKKNDPRISDFLDEYESEDEYWEGEELFNFAGRYLHIEVLPAEGFQKYLLTVLS